MSDLDPHRRLPGPVPQADVDDELSFHLDMRIRELVERGETPERARALALRRFGELAAARDECIRIDERRRRHMARSDYASELRQDIGYALRTLRRAPGFTAVAVATLALGIGANSTIFSVVEGVLLQALPYRSADQLYEVRTLYPDGTGYSLSAPDFMSMRADTRVFDGFEAYSGTVLTLLGTGEPKEIRGAVVSDGLFEMLGMNVVLGRGFAREENEPGRDRVAILDHGFWQRDFGGSSDVLGRSLNVGGATYEVVGVLASGAGLPTGGRRSRLNEADIYAPLAYASTFSAATPTSRRSEFLRVIGRVRPGVAAAQAGADLGRVGTQLQETFPQTNGRLTFMATPLRDVILGDVRTPLLVLLGAVGFVLLVACANVANLVLARASSRQGELAVRAALGAGRGRLLRQLLTEAAVLGLIGGVLGLAIAYGGTRALIAAQPADIPRLDSIGMNGTVVAFTLIVALVTGLAFGAIPALQATGRGLMGSLREGARGGVGGHRVRGGLVVAEMALAVVLLTGAGLLVRSFIALTQVSPGFEPAHALQMRITMQGDEYRNGQQIRNRVGEMLERIRALPGVASAGGSTQLPLSGRGSILNFAVDDAPPPPEDVNAEIGVVSVTPSFFETMGTTLRSGRDFDVSDHSEAPAVAIINEAAVRLWFGGESPLGRRVTVGSANPEVIGVVADVLQGDPSVPALPELYRPYAQRTSRSIRFVVRTAGDPLARVPALRGALHTLDPNLPIAEVAPLEALVSSSVARPRFYTSLLTLFAAVGLTLAATGIFGVMSYSVAQRKREISIRMALGARAGEVAGMIVGRAMALAALGAGLGIAAAIVFGRVLRSQLYGVDPIDPLTLASVVVVLGASAAIASWLPARRGASLDPATALRGD
jgi:predicted permease